MYDQPIVERKDSSPLATSLLAISVVCLIVASTLLCMRLKELTYKGNSPTTSAKKWEDDGLRRVTQDAKKLFADVDMDIDEG